MPTVKRISTHQRFAQELRGLVEISQEVSVMNMQQVRQSVLLNRTYMDGIIDIFTDVRRSHQAKIQSILDEHAKGTTQRPNKKPAVAILLSPSGKFAGPLIKKVFQDFTNHVADKTVEIAIVGNTGRSLVQQSLGTATSFEYFPFNLDHPTDAELSQLLNYVVQFDSITLFAGRFQSLAVQDSKAFNISGFESLNQTEFTNKTEDTLAREFLFEPELDQITTFFEAQVVAALFRQTVDESKLANLGSRIMTLESSLTGIDQELHVLKRRFRKAQRHQENRKQFNRISGMKLWS
jgi:F0F1-type ATP synthase gamma subunit